MCCLEARELGFRTPTPVSHGRKPLLGWGARRLRRHFWDSVWPPRASRGCMRATLCLAGGGGCLQRRELVKRTQDLRQARSAWGRSLWGCIFQQPGQSSTPEPGRRHLAKSRWEAICGLCGSTRRILLRDPCQSAGGKPGKLTLSLPAWALCSVHTFPPALGCAWSPEL